jgi:acyl carrier protein
LIEGDEDRMSVTLDRKAIERNIREFIVSNFLFGVDDGALRREDSFLHKGIIDSTGVLELVGYLEQSYKIEVGDHELVAVNLDSIENVAAYVCRKLGS